MKRIFVGFFFLLVFFMYSCSDDVATVKGTVEASYLKGVNVCLQGTDTCKKTDENGQFEFKYMVLPAHLQLKLGNTILAEITVNKKDTRITPKVLAGDNETLASYIGAFLHNAAGCDMSADTCDLSNIDNITIKDADNKTEVLTKQIETLLKAGQSDIECSVDDTDNKTAEIKTTKEDADKYDKFNPEMTGKAQLPMAGFSFGGEFSTLTYDKNNKKLTYTFENDNITQTLQNSYKNVIFKDSDNETNNLYFLSYGLDVFQNGDSDFIFALQNTTDNITVDNKTYNYIEPDGTIGKISLYSDKTWKSTIINSDGEAEESGNWELYNNQYIEVPGYGKVYMQPGPKRSSFIISSVGYGLEAKEITADDIVGTYYYFTTDVAENPVICYGKAQITKTGDSAKLSYNDAWCSDGSSDSGSYDLELNPTIDDIKFSGTIKLKDMNAYMLVNPDTGVSVLTANEDGDHTVLVGTSKPIQ